MAAEMATEKNLANVQGTVGFTERLPTPDEISLSSANLETVRLVQERVGKSPLNPAFWREVLETFDAHTLTVVLWAVLNQPTVAEGKEPLITEEEVSRRITVAALPAYMIAVARAFGIQQETAPVEISEGNGRPFDAKTSETAAKAVIKRVAREAKREAGNPG